MPADEWIDPQSLRPLVTLFTSFIDDETYTAHDYAGVVGVCDCWSVFERPNTLNLYTRSSPPTSTDSQEGTEQEL